MSKKNGTFKNKKTEYTYAGINWDGVELETIQDLAFAQAKTQALDHWLDQWSFNHDGDNNLGVIPMKDALSVKVERATLTAKVATIKSGIQDAIDQVRAGTMTLDQAQAYIKNLG